MSTLAITVLIGIAAALVFAVRVRDAQDMPVRSRRGTELLRMPREVSEVLLVADMLRVPNTLVTVGMTPRSVTIARHGYAALREQLVRAGFQCRADGSWTWDAPAWAKN